jgi:DNA adenine methylase
MQALGRPLLRYHGGKWKLAPWIISHFPIHRIYVEPFGGAASVLLRKARCYAEVYNDLDEEIVNLFRVLRNPSQARELIRLVTLTPYSREEFDESYITAADPIEQARRTVLRAAAGFGGGVTSTSGWKTGFRGSVTRSGSTPAQDWANMPEALEGIVERLRGVTIEHDTAVNVMTRYDGENVLHYVDPPYPYSTRNARHAGSCYRHEMDDDQHRELAAVLRGLKGMVIVSGYACPLYDDELFVGWDRVERDIFADGARARTEVLWMKGVSMQGRLFDASFG